MEWLERKRSTFSSQTLLRGIFLSLSLCSVILLQKAFDPTQREEWEEDEYRKKKSYELVAGFILTGKAYRGVRVCFEEDAQEGGVCAAVSAQWVKKRHQLTECVLGSWKQSLFFCCLRFLFFFFLCLWPFIRFFCQHSNSLSFILHELTSLQVHNSPHIFYHGSNKTHKTSKG